MDSLSKPTSDISNAESSNRDSETKQVPQETQEANSTFSLENHRRKQRYVFPGANKIPRKVGRFYFLTESMVKGQKLKNPTKKRRARKKEEVAKNDSNSTLLVKNGSKLLNYPRQDIFCSEEVKCNYEAPKKVDLYFHIVDEIALEGLDGITIEAFWKRLGRVFPNSFNKTISDKIWRLICSNKQLAFHIMNKARGKLYIFDFDKHRDPETGVFIEPLVHIKDIYPMAIVNDSDVRGSCSTFESRKESNMLRRFSMEKVLNLHDRKFVIVADQAMRNKALISEETDPNVELLDIEYCMMERIGRSRHRGELTQGKMSLLRINKNDKAMHHNRKALSQHFLITNQFFYIKSLSMMQTISGTLVHLPRFYAQKKTQKILLLEEVAEMLKLMPNYQMEMADFRKIFQRPRFLKRIIKSAEFRKFFKVLTFSHRKVYPNSTRQEYMCKNGSKERYVPILRLVDPFANVTAILNSRDTKPTLENTEIVQETINGCKQMNLDYLKDIFLYILRSGRKGVTMQDINDYFEMDFYSVRIIIKKLQLRKVIDYHKIDQGRQHVLRFYARCLKDPGLQISSEPTVDYQLSETTLNRIEHNYESIAETVTHPGLNNTNYIPTITATFNLPSFGCTIFLTESVDEYSQDLATISDIVIKGRDRLLLAHSNLAVHYITEWQYVLSKAEPFAQVAPIFRDEGFGKIICDYLVDLIINGYQLEDKIEASEKSVDKHTVLVISNRRNSMDLTCFYSNNKFVEFFSKMYLFEAAMNESHVTTEAERQLGNVVEKSMLCLENKRKKSTPSGPGESATILDVKDNVTMEKFMGGSPQLVHCETSGEGIKTEIFRSTPPAIVMKISALADAGENRKYSAHFVRRCNIVLRVVNEEVVVRGRVRLFKEIKEGDVRHNYDNLVCKKSVESILAKLVLDGYLKVFKILLTGHKMTRSQVFVCLPHVTHEHELIQSTLEQLRLKFYVGTVVQAKTVTVKKTFQSPFSANDVRSSIREMRQLSTTRGGLKHKFDKGAGRRYGYCTKFVRMRVLHELLFYIVRELDHRTKPPTVEEVRDDAMVTWKTFIPPLSSRNNWPRGWTLACDVILRMPLSIFVKLYCVSYAIPELDDMLRHPVRRHCLIRDLPMDVRNTILHKRKYFHSIYEMLSQLCYIGLLQMGPRSYKEKDQLFIYVNVNACLYDTSPSQPGYNHVEARVYEKKSFHFGDSQQVELYWTEMWRICMNTTLGKRKILMGQTLTISHYSRDVVFQAVTKAKTFEKAVSEDTGHVPGDRKGAAGLDSSLWSHLRRNWTWAPPIKAELPTPSSVPAVPKAIQFDSLQNEKSALKVRTKINKRKRKRILMLNPRKRVREYYDSIDREIMKANPHTRVEWCEEEDQLLRLLRAGALFLCPVMKRQVVPYTVIRDVLHRVRPESRNKTNRAIQRRIYFLSGSDEFSKIMDHNVENLLNSGIGKYFYQIRNRFEDKSFKLTEAQLFVCYIFLMAFIIKHKKEMELLLLGYIATVDFFSDSYRSFFEAIINNMEGKNRSDYDSNPAGPEDIQRSTIKAVVHCSMYRSQSRKEGRHWIYQLYHIYKRYPDEMIRNVFTELKKSQFLALSKKSENKLLTSLHLPMKFSYLYKCVKMNNNSNFRHRTFRETYKCFRSDDRNFLFCNEIASVRPFDLDLEVPETAIILNPEIEDHHEIIAELAKGFHNYLEKIKKRGFDDPETDKMDASTVESNDGDSIDTIKSDVMHLIFRVPYLFENEVELYFKKLNESGDKMEIRSYIALLIVELRRYLKGLDLRDHLNTFLADTDSIGGDQDEKSLIENLSKLVFVIQNLHLIDLPAKCDSLDDKFRRWFEVELSAGTNQSSGRGDLSLLTAKKSNTTMDNCIKRAQEGIVPDLDEIEIGMMMDDCNESGGRDIPHITDLVVFLAADPEEDKEAIDKMKNHFVAQYPKLSKFHVDGVMSDEIVSFGSLDQIVGSDIVNTQPQHEKLSDFVAKAPGDRRIAMIELIEDLLNFISDHRQIGASAVDISAKFATACCTKSELQTILVFLCEINLILRVGATSLFYVHCDYQDDWLVDTYYLTVGEKESLERSLKEENMQQQKIRSSESIKVLLRPWTKLDGSSDFDLLDEWLWLVLTYCLDHPNIPLVILCKHFCYLKPVDVFYLLEVLERIKCLEIWAFTRPENCLFGPRDVVNEAPATCLDDFEDMFVKPGSLAGLNFGAYLQETASGSH